MDPKVQFVLFLVAFIFFVLDTIAIPEHPRFRWLGAGLATFTLVFLGNAFKAI